MFVSQITKQSAWGTQHAFRLLQQKQDTKQCPFSLGMVT